MSCAVGSGICTVLAAAFVEHEFDVSTDWHCLVVAQPLPIQRRIFQGVGAQFLEPSRGNTSVSSGFAVLAQERLGSKSFPRVLSLKE
mmetsp:Transcript_12946/g.22465  ORF Transcript_12946/g.22465 Transcript_12946/m.22465 type:complete len:87 (+) Transcript_12946:1127-1387(+)